MNLRYPFSLASIFAFRMLGLFMILPVFSIYAEHLNGATPKLIGITLGIYGLTQACLQIPFGMLSDRFGRKPLIIIGLLLFILGSIVAALSTSITGVLIGRALQGAGAIGSVILALLADLTPVEERTKAIAIVGITIAFAFALALILGPVFNTWIGVPGIFWLTAALGAIGIVILLTTLPTPTQQGIQVDVEALPALFGSMLRQPELLRLDLGIFVLHCCLTAVFVVLPLILTHFLGLAEKREWLLYLPVILFSFIIAIALIRIAEKRNQTRRFLLSSIVAMIIALLGLLFLPLNLTMMGICLLIFFSGFTFLEATLPSLISKLAPAGGKGTAMGIYSTLQFLGIFVGGSVAGLLFSAEHFSAVLWFCIILLIIWFGNALGMKKAR